MFGLIVVEETTWMSSSFSSFSATVPLSSVDIASLTISMGVGCVVVGFTLAGGMISISPSSSG